MFNPAMTESELIVLYSVLLIPVVVMVLLHFMSHVLHQVGGRKRKW